jgi:hypothetical protein
MIDQLRAEHAFQMPVWVAPEHQAEWDRTVPVVAEIIDNPDLPVLLIDNVAQYYFEGTDQEFWDLREDFPNLAPPFPAFWCEHRLGGKIHSKEKGDSNLAAMIGSQAKVGALIQAFDPKDVTGQDIPEGTRWIYWCELFIDWGRKGDRPAGPHGSMFFCVDAEGRILDRPSMRSFAREADADYMRSLMTWLHPAFLAICFLHCKNVEVVEQTVDKPLAKKWKQKTGKWPCNYKTLVIEPLKAILRKEGGAGNGTGLAKALHICRGHFRDYREGRGLFGKYKQLVWTPMTVRGTRGKKPPPREIEVKV